MKKRIVFSLLVIPFLAACGADKEHASPSAFSSTVTETESRTKAAAVSADSGTNEPESETESETVLPSAVPCTTAPEPETETVLSTVPERVPAQGELVRILDYIPDAVIDLRYATENNFTGTVIYDDAEAYLCYGTVKKLTLVQEELKEKGFRIIIWDAYRSEEAQWRLWEVCPNPTYVADPRKGVTSHSRGNTIDIGIVCADGSEAELPSAFDEFSSLADRDYSDVSSEAAENARLLEEVMYRNGFTGYRGEWWDYSDTDIYELIIPSGS